MSRIDRFRKLSDQLPKIRIVTLVSHKKRKLNWFKPRYGKLIWLDEIGFIRTRKLSEEISDRYMDGREWLPGEFERELAKVSTPVTNELHLRRKIYNAIVVAHGMPNFVGNGPR